MKRVFIFCMLLALIASLSGCNVPTPIASKDATTPTQPALTLTAPPINTPLPTGTQTQAVTPPPEASFTPLPDTPTVAAPTETPGASTGGITSDLLKNFTYVVENPDTRIPLKDGVYVADHVNSRLVEPIAFGDLNGDGKQDAAVIIASNFGGSGTFYDLIPVIDQNGTPTQAGYDAFGDRSIIKNLQIADGRMILEYITQGLGEPFCCPTEHRLRSYLLDNGAPHLASEQILVNPTDPAIPLPDAVLIDQPVMWDKLTTRLLVHGRVSQVPPEKKLEYDVTDLSASLLDQGEVPLEGEVGGPGTFSFEVTFDAVPKGTIKLELIDSAAGILRGRSIVELLGE